MCFDELELDSADVFDREVFPQLLEYNPYSIYSMQHQLYTIHRELYYTRKWKRSGAYIQVLLVWYSYTILCIELRNLSVYFSNDFLYLRVDHVYCSSVIWDRSSELCYCHGVVLEVDTV